MKKKFNHYVSLSLLLLSVLPFSLVSAETVEEVPTGETTISSMADDPLKELKEKAAIQVPTIESTPESESVEDTPTSESETKEDVPKTEDTTETKPKPQTRGDGIGPQAVNLIEGVDIDAQFAKFLREGSQGMNETLGQTNFGFTGTGKAPNTLTNEDMETLTFVSTFSFMSTPFNSVEGIEYAKNIEIVHLDNNNFTTLDFSHNTKVTNMLLRGSPSLTSLNVSNCSELGILAVTGTSLATLDVTANLKLTRLDIRNSQISSINLSNNLKLDALICSDSPISSLSIDHLADLYQLSCDNTKITSLDVTQNSKLAYLYCYDNALGTLDVTGNPDLYSLLCNNTQINSLDVTQNPKLYSLDCKRNQIEALDISQNPDLVTLICYDNKISSMDASHNPELKRIECQNNEIGYLNVANTKLEYLDCRENHISDISSANGLTNLTYLEASNQQLSIPVPAVISNQATVDILKTAASAGLNVLSTSIVPTPTVTTNGDKIELGNVTRESMDSKSISFDYNKSQLIEGATSYIQKAFSGGITFFSVSDLGNDIRPDTKKVKSGEKVKWTWTIASLTSKKAEDIHAKLTLPVGLILDTSSIQIDGVSGSLADIDGSNSLGDLDFHEGITITFETTVNGTVDEWLEAEAELKWTDDTPSSPHTSQEKGRVQVHDDEQTYTPKDSHDMAIQSVPVYFNHGTNPIMSTAQTYHLHAMNYQSNTNVVTDGFYTRIKDDRAISTGWKLTAKLSDFKDSSNQPMPNGTGTMLKLENMSIERVTDRDTPQEVIDPTPTGADVPSSVQATETLIAGQSTAKTIVSAQMNEGQDTWQLRMPFDKVSLSIPANAGKKKTVYKANLTWSLDDTP